MELNIESLSSAGAFTGPPVKKEITWEQEGETLTATVHIRKLSYHSVAGDIKAATSGQDVIAARIAQCLCDAKGKAIFTAEDVTGEADPQRGPLNGNLTMALLAAIGEVNGLGKTPTA